MISFGLHLFGLPGHRVHVDDLVLAPHGVVRGLEPLAGHIDRRTMGEMAAGGEIEAHEGIAGLQQRQEHRLVHLAAGVGLHVGELRAEQFLGAIDRQCLHHVDPFAAAVIAIARIAFGIFVGQHRALRFQHRAADDVFRRDQLDLMALAAEFALDRGGDIRIGLGEGGGEERVGRGGGPGAGRWSCSEGSWAKYLHRRNLLGGVRAVCVAVESGTSRDIISDRNGQALAVQACYLCKIWWGWVGTRPVSSRAAVMAGLVPAIPRPCIDEVRRGCPAHLARSALRAFGRHARL